MNKIENKNNFNLLRFFFASMVIVSHTPELQNGNRGHEILTQIFGTISFGELAVDSFFILSGFLIVKSWGNNPSILPFLSNRILRIYPGFIVASLLCAFIVGPIYSASTYFNNFEWLIFWVGLIKLNLSGIPPVFQITPYPMLNGSLWTIPFEFKCYLTTLLLGMTGILNKRRICLTLFMLFAACHMANRVFLLNLHFESYIRFNMAFMAGACFYLFRDRLTWGPRTAWLSFFIFLLSLFIKSLAELGTCIFWGYTILNYAISGKMLLGFNKYPDVSYGIYLYAWPVSKIFLWHFPSMNAYILMFAIFITSVSLGILSWYAIEKPFISLKKVFHSTPRAASSASECA